METGIALGYKHKENEQRHEIPDIKISPKSGK